MSKQSETIYKAPSRVPLPPTDADVMTTCCDYCSTACGYKVYRWPTGKEGGPKPAQNALGIKYAANPLSGGWISPNMHNVVTHKGRPHNVVIIPDKDSKVVNLGGDHSIRGGCIAQKCYNPKTPTRDRLQYPQMRVNGKLERISWDDATDIMAELIRYTIDKFGESAYVQKQYSYGFHENLYVTTKFALRHIATPAFAFHDNPGNAPSVPGFTDAGIDPFSASYQDWYEADVAFISGTDPYETKTVMWNEWFMRGTLEHGQKQIFVNPRRTAGPAFAEKNGGLHLQLIPGTDTVLHMALTRLIIENGWQDDVFIKHYIGNKWESNSGFGRGIRDTPVQWRTTWGAFQTDGFEDYKKWLLTQKESELDYAAEFCGLPKAKIVKAAEMMAKPKADGSRVKLSVALEKGLYWSNNYLNTASIATMGLICGSGNRPGQMISRLGGHQRGASNGGSYPRSKGPDKFAGRRRMTMDVDKWVEAGHARFAYVIGTTWVAAMAASQAMQRTMEKLTIGHPQQITRNNKKHAIEVLKKRMDEKGTVFVHQDIYLRQPLGTKISDLVFPASGWGENDFARENAERRLRLYSKFNDAPGEAKPDWWIVAQIATKMGFPNFNWKHSHEIFDESMRSNRKGRRNYQPLVAFARAKGQTGHDALRELGTEGIQAPIRVEDGKLLGTVRLHDSTLKVGDKGPEGFTWEFKKLKEFGSHSGKAQLMRSPWFIFGDFYEAQKPKDDELWITSGRSNEIWQTGFDDVERRPYITQRWPENFIEIHPDDAKKRGIESGDYVEAYSDRVPVQTGGFIARTVEQALYTGLLKDGNIKFEKGSIRLVAVVSEVVRPGVAFTNALDTTQPANALVPRVTDPISGNYRFKLGVGRLKRIGESPYKHSFTQMSFGPRAFT